MAGSSTRNKSDGSGFQGQGSKGDYSSRARDSYNTTISRNQAANRINTTTVPKNNRGMEQWSTFGDNKGRVRKTVNPWLGPKYVKPKPLEIDIPGYPAKKKVKPKTAVQKKQQTAKKLQSQSNSNKVNVGGKMVTKGYGYGQGSKAGGGVGTVSSGGKTTTGGYSAATGGAFSGSGAVRGGYGQK